jgi:tRNA pseudouridine38-40 synthase
MRRWKCICAYDGSGFSGWQSQPRGDSVQDTIERRLAAVLGVATRVHGSGRTDSGVHALGQVFHFDAKWSHGPEKLAAALRHKLPSSIQIVSVRPAAANFHARFGAKSKVYEYHLHLGDADPFTRPYVWVLHRPVDLVVIRKAAAALEGRHDFRAFSAYNGAEPGEKSGTVRNLLRLGIVVRGRNIRVIAEADGFLYKMVRSLVGALVAAGEGKLSLNEIVSHLKSGIRTAAVQTAPPQGLFLRRVRYR